MIICPDCQHQNPDLAPQCGACQALLAIPPCPNCGAPTQVNARFCGQCGSRLEQGPPRDDSDLAVPLPAELNPPALLSWPGTSQEQANSSDQGFAQDAELILPLPPSPTCSPLPDGVEPKTELQRQTAYLLHVQSQTAIPLPQQLPVIHIGKPNDQVPPDIDVAGFPHSEIVSRVHADIRSEADRYFIEDVGSVNGTYINHTALLTGNRHRLRHGDRIALGKGDLVMFLFQLH